MIGLDVAGFAASAYGHARSAGADCRNYIDGVLWKYVHYSQEVIAYANITNPAINQIQQIYTGVEDQYEQYKLSDDPTEIVNLAWPGKGTAESIAVRPRLEAILAEQRKTKRLTPIVNQGTLRQDGEGATANATSVDPATARLPIGQPGAQP